MKLKRTALLTSTLLLCSVLFVGCGKTGDDTAAQTLPPITLPPTPDMATPTIEATIEPTLEDPVPVFGSSVTAAPYTLAPSPTATPKPTEKTSSSSASKNSSSTKKSSSNSSSSKTAKPSSDDSSSSGIDFDDIPSEIDTSSDNSSDAEVEIPIDDSDVDSGGDSSDDEIPVVDE